MFVFCFDLSNNIEKMMVFMVVLGSEKMIVFMVCHVLVMTLIKFN